MGRSSAARSKTEDTDAISRAWSLAARTAGQLGEEQRQVAGVGAEHPGDVVPGSRASSERSAAMSGA